jgi:hypothetical protein
VWVGGRPGASGALGLDAWRTTSGQEHEQRVERAEYKKGGDKINNLDVEMIDLHASIICLSKSLHLMTLAQTLQETSPRLTPHHRQRCSGTGTVMML